MSVPQPDLKLHAEPDPPAVLILEEARASVRVPRHGRLGAEARAAVQESHVLSQRLLAEGWTPGTPLIVTKETMRVDREVCRLTHCPRCRRQRGLAYLPFVRRHRYKVVGQCPRCGNEVEL